MKRADTEAVAASSRSLWGRLLRFHRSLGLRSRVFFYFLLFTGLLLVLLWLFQIEFLDDFYRLQKTDMLRSSSNSIVGNIDNDDLQTLVDRIAEENSVCVLVVDEDMDVVCENDITPRCVIHHMSRRDLRHYAQMLKTQDAILFRVFPMMGFRNDQYDANKFKGFVPPSDDGNINSMLTAQRATLANGQTLYVFLNAVITPVTSTVQTIRTQLWFITVILILLSFLLSLVLSRRISRPLADTTAAAQELSAGRFTPVKSARNYREIDELNQQLTQAAKDLHRVEEMQRELIANISHDLRTPLTLIEGYGEVMRDLPGENTPENIQVIIDEAKRLSTLVNAVLDYSTAQNGAPPDVKRFDLTGAIRGILKRYQKLTDKDGYRIVFEPDADAYVDADEVKVGQVVYNLINNALTYTGADKTVTVRQTMLDGKVRIEIADTGEGIDSQELPHIWNRYYRGQKPHKRATVGSGLGLNIVKGILDNHHLEYGVESEQSKGSTFWFMLPLSAQDRPSDKE